LGRWGITFGQKGRLCLCWSCIIGSVLSFLRSPFGVLRFPQSPRILVASASRGRHHLGRWDGFRCTTVVPSQAVEYLRWYWRECNK
jgi:hypothetical protein